MEKPFVPHCWMEENKGPLPYAKTTAVDGLQLCCLHLSHWWLHQEQAVTWTQVETFLADKETLRKDALAQSYDLHALYKGLKKKGIQGQLSTLRLLLLTVIMGLLLEQVEMSLTRPMLLFGMTKQQVKWLKDKHGKWLNQRELWLEALKQDGLRESCLCKLMMDDSSQLVTTLLYQPPTQ